MRCAAWIGVALILGGSAACKALSGPGGIPFLKRARRYDERMERAVEAERAGKWLLAWHQYGEALRYWRGEPEAVAGVTRIEEQGRAALLEEAAAHVEGGAWTEALGALAQANVLAQDDPHVVGRAAFVRAMRRVRERELALDLDGAAAACDEALQVAPEEKIAGNTRARLRAEIGRREGSIGYLSAMERGLHAMERGQWAEASAAFADADDFVPGDPKAGDCGSLADLEMPWRTLYGSIPYPFESPPAGRVVAAEFGGEGVLRTVHSTGALAGWDPAAFLNSEAVLANPVAENGVHHVTGYEGPHGQLRLESRLYALAVGRGPLGWRPHTVVVTDFSNGQNVSSHPFFPDEKMNIDRITCVALSMDGSKVAAGADYSAGIKAWDVESGELLHDSGGEYWYARSIAFHASGSWIYAAGESLPPTSWSVLDGSKARRFGTTPSVTIALDPQSEVLAAASEEGTVTLWDTATGSELRTFEVEDSLVMGPGLFVPVGAEQAIASVLRDGVVDLRNDDHPGWVGRDAFLVRAGTREARMEDAPYPVNCLRFDPSGSVLACGRGDGAIELVDVATGRRLQYLRGHYHPITALAFGPSGYLASGDELGTIGLWGPPPSE